MESTPLEVKTSSKLGSNKQMKVELYAGTGSKTGSVAVKFSSTPQYRLFYFEKSYRNFPTTLPDATDKVWRITVGKSSDTRSVQIHCNNVEVLNVEISHSLCEVATWKSYWMKERVAIVFPSSDTASNFYRPYTGNKISRYQMFWASSHPVFLPPRALLKRKGHQ